MGIAVIVFSFPEPEDSMELGSIIQKSKAIFEDMPDVKVHAAVRDAADSIMSIINPEADTINETE